MRTLPNLKLTEQQLNILLKNVLSEGSEGLICQGENPNTVYKFFFGENRDTRPNVTHKKEELTEMADNKHSKIQRLYQDKVEGLVQPVSTISCDGILLGYEITRNPNDIALIDYLKQQNPTREERIAILKNAKKRLEYFAHKDIIYGDVATRNILVDPTQPNSLVTYCDIDNMQVGPYPIDLIPRDARQYHHRRGIDEKLDAYMHNFMIFPALRLNFELIDYYCMRELIPYDFEEEATPIILSMENPEQFIGEYIINHVKTTERRVEYLKSLRGK